MGLHSWDCLHCHRALLSEHTIGDLPEHYMQAVAILPDGRMGIGPYDGYGTVGYDGLCCDWSTHCGPPLRLGAERGPAELVSVYHRRCWELAGKPTTYQGPSTYAHDQGWPAMYDTWDAYRDEVPA